MIVLDAKTDYSFMRGFGTSEQWLERCKDVGCTAFGIADYCSVWGHTPFRKAFKNSGVKLIYGVQLPVVAHLDKDPRFSLATLIAHHDLKSLYKLTSLSYEQSYYRPRITWAQLKDFDGFVILDYVLPHHKLHAERLDKTKAFIGLSPSTAKLKLDRVPAYGPRFPSPELRQGYQLFQAISEGQRLGEIDGSGLHLLRQSEFDTVYDNILKTDDMDNLHMIALECNADIPRGTLIVPKVYKNKRKQLRKMAIDGAASMKDQSIFLQLMGPDGGNPYHIRLERELDVICTKNFEDYFFFVADIVAWAKQRMFVGPGRGSAGGSLLCYLLGITSVDPLKFNTMFERFIDITRPDLPDIDIDFPDNRREEVFAYLKEKYGEERVARLGTISEFGGKSAINDVARATGVPFDIAREFGKYTEGAGQGMVISPGRIFGTSPQNTLLSPEHYKLFEKYPQIGLAAIIDGHARHHGVHAAGVVVTQGPVTDFGALTKEGVLTMDMRAAEDIGLVKMDALGLRTLSVIQAACDMAGIDPRTLYDLDWENPKVYDAIFNKDRVTGIFQFEGHAVRSLMKGLGKVERFDDLCALTSLARPGPLIGGAAEAWVKARRGDTEPRILHPSLESTFGVIVYQENFMQIVRDLAGFSEPDVNGARRAIGKKLPEKLRSYREKFVAGATEHFAKEISVGDLKKELGNYDRADAATQTQQLAEERAAALWDEISEFGSYSFNYSHAVEYAMISFMCAYLKWKFPLQFAAACLTYAVDDEQGKNLLRELKEEGYEYVPFDVERSEASWSIRDSVLYGGFDSVRGIGSKTASNLVAIRASKGPAWIETLTASQRERLTQKFNTPWDELTFFGDNFAAIYEKPEEFKRAYAPAGFRGPVLRIKDIPGQKGNYAFLGRITRTQKRDMNDETRVAKRDGKRFETNTHFINVGIEDDTGEIGATINRFKSADFQWLLEENMKGRNFFFRGNIIGDDRRWIFIDNIVELKEDAP